MDSLNPNLTPGDLKGFIRHNYTTLAIQHAPLLSLILRFKRFIICALFICSIYTLLICSVEEQSLDSSKEPIEAELEAHANCTRLKFRSGDDRPKTALVSYPGSGNTWSRHLVELITGVFTGSIYEDPDLRIPFPGEGKHGSSVSAIKTHWPLFAQEQDLLDYDRIILVVRDPEDAIRSSYVFHKSGENHTGLLNENWEVKDWSTYLDSCLQEWESFHEFWINHALSHRLPLLVLNYAAMKTDINSTVYKMAAFLDAPLSEERARCVLANQEGGFHRVKHGRVEEILPSTETQRQESMRMAARMRTIIGKCLSERHCDTNEHSMTLPSQ